MTRVGAAIALLAGFLWHVVASGLTTAWRIVRPGPRVSPVIVPLPYEGLSRGGAVVYACLLSLTPGTTAIDLDDEARVLHLHVLDGRDAGRALGEVRRSMEPRLRALFPETSA